MTGVGQTRLPSSKCSGPPPIRLSGARRDTGAPASRGGQACRSAGLAPSDSRARLRRQYDLEGVRALLGQLQPLGEAGERQRVGDDVGAGY